MEGTYQKFAQGGMGMDGGDDIGGGKAVGYCHTHFLNEIGSVGAAYMAAEKLAALAHDHFHHSVGLVHGERFAR